MLSNNIQFTKDGRVSATHIITKDATKDNSYLIESETYQAKNEYDAVKQAYKNAKQIKMIKYNGDDEWLYDQCRRYEYQTSRLNISYS